MKGFFNTKKVKFLTVGLLNITILLFIFIDCYSRNSGIAIFIKGDRLDQKEILLSIDNGKYSFYKAGSEKITRCILCGFPINFYIPYSDSILIELKVDGKFMTEKLKIGKRNKLFVNLNTDPDNKNTDIKILFYEKIISD